MPEDTIVKYKDGFVRQAAERAILYVAYSGSCCQGIIAAFQELLGLEDDLALKVGSYFGGGPGRGGGTCGALVGGVMVLGMKYGRTNLSDFECLNPGMERSLRLVREFEGEFGTCSCRDITGFDLTCEDGRKGWREAGLNLKCLDTVIRKVAETVAELISEEIPQMVLRTEVRSLAFKK